MNIIKLINSVRFRVSFCSEEVRSCHLRFPYRWFPSGNVVLRMVFDLDFFHSARQAELSGRQLAVADGTKSQRPVCESVSRK